MSIQSQLERIKSAVESAFTACNAKNATMPEQQIVENLSSCIESISNGITPAGTLDITANGEHDVASYAKVLANISGLTHYECGQLVLSSDNYGTQTSYETSNLKIELGFVPKIFIFYQNNYTDGFTTGVQDSSCSVMISSFSCFDGVTTDENYAWTAGPHFSGFITKNGVATISRGNTGFKLNVGDKNEVWWYMELSSYKIRAGTWWWEAFG